MTKYINIVIWPTLPCQSLRVAMTEIYLSLEIFDECVKEQHLFEMAVFCNANLFNVIFDNFMNRK